MTYNSDHIRLPKDVIEKICDTFKQHFLVSDRLFIFGSRTDLNKWGGDIDLYIETHLENYTKAVDHKIAFGARLQEVIGEQKIDIIVKLVSDDKSLPIFDIAKKEGIRIV